MRNGWLTGLAVLLCASGVHGQGDGQGGTWSLLTSPGMDPAKSAITEYMVAKKEGQFSLLEIHPKTGRTHQIRVHLASIGHPIVGDVLYGKKVQPAFARRLMLHAASLEFSNNIGTHFVFEAPLPHDFTCPQD